MNRDIIVMLLALVVLGIVVEQERQRDLRQIEELQHAGTPLMPFPAPAPLAPLASPPKPAPPLPPHGSPPDLRVVTVPMALEEMR